MNVVQRTISKKLNHKRTRTSNTVSITLDLWNVLENSINDFSRLENIFSFDKIILWISWLVEMDFVLQLHCWMNSRNFESKCYLWLVLKSMKLFCGKCCILILHTHDTWKTWMYWASCECMVGRNQNTCSCSWPASGLGCMTWLNWTRVVGLSWYNHLSCFAMAGEIWMRRAVLEKKIDVKPFVALVLYFTV